MKRLKGICSAALAVMMLAGTAEAVTENDTSVSDTAIECVDEIQYGEEVFHMETDLLNGGESSDEDRGEQTEIITAEPDTEEDYEKNESAQETDSGNDGIEGENSDLNNELDESEEKLEESTEESRLIEEMKETLVVGVYFTNTFVPGEKMAQQVKKQMAWTYPGQYTDDTQFLIDAGFVNRIINDEYWHPNPSPAGFYEQVLKNTTAVVYGIEERHAQAGDLVFFNLNDKNVNTEMRVPKNARKLKEETSGNIYSGEDEVTDFCAFNKAGIVIQKDTCSIDIAYYDDLTGITSVTLDYTDKAVMDKYDGAKVVSLSYYTNENIVFRYLQEVFPEFNKAAVTGILVNMRMESGFNQYSSSDDGTSYGLCMWHNLRAEKLKNYLEDNGYDDSSLKGQLLYLRNELTSEETYRYIYDVLCNIEDTSGGAYEAASEFCRVYEAPTDSEAMSILRGRIAREVFYPFYCR